MMQNSAALRPRGLKPRHWPLLSPAALVGATKSARRNLERQQATLEPSQSEAGAPISPGRRRVNRRSKSLEGENELARPPFRPASPTGRRS